MTKIMSVHVFDDSATPATAKQIDEQVKTNDGPVYVFYSHPSVYLAHELEVGSAASNACSKWFDGIHQAFDLQRRNRRKIRMVCLQDALEHQQELEDKVGFKGNDFITFEISPSQINLMAANQIMLQDERFTPLIQWLEASTLQLAEQPYSPIINVEGVLKQLDEQALQFKRLEEQYNALWHRNDELESENKQLMGLVHELRSEALDPARLKEAEEENELLMLQLVQVQEELDSCFNSYKASENNCKKLENHLASLEKTKSEFDEKRLALIYKDKVAGPLSENIKLINRLAENQERLDAIFSSQTKHSGDSSSKSRIKSGVWSSLTRHFKLKKRKHNDTGSQVKKHILILQRSDYFDAEWYLEQYPDLKKAGVNPAEHYLRFGGFESRNPGPKFNSAFYLKKYKDVARKGVNPLLHFILFGQAEGRLPAPRAKIKKN